MAKSIIKKLWHFVNKYGDFLEYRTKRAINIIDPDKVPESLDFNSIVKIGIIKERWHMHRYYVDACRELEVSYQVIDLFKSDWMDVIKRAGVDVLIVRPSVVSTHWKHVVDDKLNIIEHHLGIVIFPNRHSLWFWESKHRMSYWLEANKLPCVKTRIFHYLEEALDFSNDCVLPVVFKAGLGSGGRGVKIISNRKKLKGFIRSYFKNGFRVLGASRSDREWGELLLQEFITNPIEWRIMRIGNSFFGYKKLAVNGLHSGSGQWVYGMPPENLLNLTLEITDQHQLYSVAIDYFLTNNEAVPLINEVQAYFGMEYKDEMCVVNGKAGRLVFENNNWKFEEGNFCRNKLCTERVRFVIDSMLKKPIMW